MLDDREELELTIDGLTELSFSKSKFSDNPKSPAYANYAMSFFRFIPALYLPFLIKLAFLAFIIS